MHSTPAFAAAPESSPKSLVLLGHPVAHSLSPIFQQAALDAAGIPVRYERADTPPATLAARLALLRATRAGGNVTAPLKEAVFRACSGWTEVAHRAGAVNTFWHTDAGALIGHNTDVEAVELAMAALLAPHGSVFTARSTGTAEQPLRVTVLGAGGVASGVLVALSNWSAVQLTIGARSPARAERLREQFVAPLRIVADFTEAVQGAALVVNATPIGTTDSAMPVHPDQLHDGTAVLDLVYKQGETAWVHAARARGLTAEDGLRMLVEQGAAAFRCWFRTEPDLSVMWAALHAAAGRTR